MVDQIQATGDQHRVPTIKFNDNRELAMNEVNQANTRLLSLFDTDNLKGVLSTKELKNFAIFKEDEFVEITDDNGHKIRDIYKLDNNEYLVNDYLTDGRRYGAGIINVETGNTDYAIFKLNENGEGTTGLTQYVNDVKVEDIDSEYDEKGNGKVTTTKYNYDENGELKDANVHTRGVQAIYNEDGSFQGVKYTDRYENVLEGQNLDVKF